MYILDVNLYICIHIYINGTTGKTKMISEKKKMKRKCIWFDAYESCVALSLHVVEYPSESFVPL